MMIEWALGGSDAILKIRCLANALHVIDGHPSMSHWKHVSSITQLAHTTSEEESYTHLDPWSCLRSDLVPARSYPLARDSPVVPWKSRIRQHGLEEICQIKEQVVKSLKKRGKWCRIVQ